MDAGSINPLASLSFISAPAVLTNASCVLLFGAGNRYARAVDRMHELSKLIDGLTDFEGEESQLQITQLEAAEDRTLFIVRALTFFYASVAAFVASALTGLLGSLSASYWSGGLTSVILAFALILGAIGVFSMIAGALLLVRETRASFTVLRQEKNVISHRLQGRNIASKVAPK